MKIPTLWQWVRLPTVFSQQEKLFLFLFGVAFLGSFGYLARTAYVANTHIVSAKGGSIVEGIIGSPRFLNPVFSDANDADRDLVQLVYSGLATYNSEGEIVPDLAKDFTIGEGGKTIEVTLKDNLMWQDGFPLSADDVIFTVATLQDPRYKSPTRANWIGVQVEKLSQIKILFKLKEPYAPFLERLTLKIIPSHIWQNISPENFAFSSYNIKPVGSGPYKVKELMRERSGTVKEIKLSPNPRYHGEKPFISSFSFRFFKNERDLQDAFRKNQIQNFVWANLLQSEGYRFSLPRYFALFFNLQATDAQDPVRNKEIRLLLEQSTNRKALVTSLFGEQGVIRTSPIMPQQSASDQELPAVSEARYKTVPGEVELLALFEKQGYNRENGKLVKATLKGEVLQRDLTVGSTGAEVEKLQHCLARDPQVYPEGIVSGTFGSKTKQAVIKFQEKYGVEAIGKVGLNTRAKLNELCFEATEDLIPLKITITTLDQYPLKQAAKELQSQWERLGIETEIKLDSAGELERNTIKPRSYQTLLFGEIVGKIADPFPFWHSSQKKDPGLNLSSYENKKVDALLEKLRKEFDEQNREAMLLELEELLLGDAPAIFLFDMPLVYHVSEELKGVKAGFITDPSQRFAQVTDWYIKTKRAWGRK